tara:strand:+ start:82 stop:366 length:285 start_codon:yes stop_codon:yes gene_type:complete
MGKINWDILGERIEQVRVDDFEGIANLVIEKAGVLFAECNEARDFCIQNVSGNSVVFGGLNRVIWHPARGFKCDEPYCSDDFIERFNHAIKEME